MVVPRHLSRKGTVGILCSPYRPTSTVVNISVLKTGSANDFETTVVQRQASEITRFVVEELPLPSRDFHNMYVLEFLMTQDSKLRFDDTGGPEVLGRLLHGLHELYRTSTVPQPRGKFIYAEQLAVRSRMAMVLTSTDPEALKAAFSCPLLPSSGTLEAFLPGMDINGLESNIAFLNALHAAYFEPLYHGIDRLTPAELAPASHNCSFLPLPVFKLKRNITFASHNLEWMNVMWALTCTLPLDARILEFGAGSGLSLLAAHTFMRSKQANEKACGVLLQKRSAIKREMRAAKTKLRTTVETEERGGGGGGLGTEALGSEDTVTEKKNLGPQVWGVDLTHATDIQTSVARTRIEETDGVDLVLAPSLAAGNEAVAAQLMLQPGTVVQLYGLKTAAYNKKWATVVSRLGKSMLSTTSRVKLKVPGSPKPLAIKVQNLRRPVTMLYTSWMDSYIPFQEGETLVSRFNVVGRATVVKREESSVLLKKPNGSFLRVPNPESSWTRVTEGPEIETCFSLLHAIGQQVSPAELATYDALYLSISGESVPPTYPLAMRDVTTGEGAPHSRILLGQLPTVPEMCFQHVHRMPTVTDNTTTYNLKDLHGAIARSGAVPSTVDGVITCDASKVRAVMMNASEAVLRRRNGLLGGATAADWVEAEAAAEAAARKHLIEGGFPMDSEARLHSVKTVMTSLRIAAKHRN